LLDHIATYLVDGRKRSRTVLGQLCGVSRAWREHFQQDSYWMPVAQDLWPVIKDHGDGIMRRQGGTYRGYILQHGRARVGCDWRVDAVPFGGRLEMHMEVWDEQDGLRILSIAGPAHFDIQYEALMSVRFLLMNEVSYSCTPFSAASRGYGTMREYVLGEGIANDYFLTRMCAEVMLRDRVSGKSAVIFRSHKYNRWTVEPDGDNYLLLSLGPYGPGWLREGEGRGFTLSYFCLRVENGQEGVAAEDRLWRAEVPDTPDDPEMPFPTCVELTGAETIKRLLQMMQP
jgi:hypothetical protein